MSQDHKQNEDLFGELRAVLHDLGGDEGSERARVREFLAIVELASEREPDAFAEQWLPYLQSQRLPQVRLLDYEEFLQLRALLGELYWETGGLEDPMLGSVQLEEAVGEVLDATMLELWREMMESLPLSSDERRHWGGEPELLAALELAADEDPLRFREVFWPCLLAADLPWLKLESVEQLELAARLLPEPMELSLRLEATMWEQDLQVVQERLSSARLTPALERLRELALRGWYMLEGDARWLTSCESLRGLRRLELRGVGMCSREALELLRSPSLLGLAELDLRENALDDDFAESIARMVRLERLERLELAGNNIELPGMVALHIAEHQPASVREDGIGEMGLRWGPFDGGYELWLGDFAQASLSQIIEVLEPPIRSLTLQGTSAYGVGHRAMRVGDVALREMASCGLLEDLEELYICQGEITPWGMQVLGGRNGLSSLVLLRTYDCDRLTEPIAAMCNASGDAITVEVC